MSENSTPQVSPRYYPRLSEIVTVDELPQFLSFVQDGLNAIFERLHYKNLQYSKSFRGDSAFYSLDVVSKEKIGFTIPGGLKLVLNPDATDESISSFPVALEYQWEILGFLRSFDLEGFSFSVEDFYKLGLQVFRISEEQVLANALNFFTEPVTTDVTQFEQLALDIIAAFPNAGFELPDDATIDAVITSINDNAVLGSVPEVIFVTYISYADEEEAKKYLQQFYNIMVPDGIEAYIKKLITPKAKASLALSAGLEFPRGYLQPAYGPLGENPLGANQPELALEVIPATAEDGSPHVTLKFAEALFYADTEKGLGYAMDFVLSSNAYAQIGNTGIVAYINNLKIDLSKDTNIAEADEDGRLADFVGVYAEELAVYLPKKWFTSIQQDTTLGVVAKKMLIGTGGFSGNVALQATDTGNAPGENDYLWFNIGSADGFKIGLNAFDMTFKQSKITHSGIKAALEIKKFKYPEGHPDYPDTVRINVEGQILEDGGFKLTGSVHDYPIVLPGVFNYMSRPEKS